ncbi:DUF1194 domain-containing protein [Hyphomicrobium sp.]|uniref:DUF1194 domain-containing protein n=1 Tax=Hyphomicrobium sp. TaxID=82 RepID=UPI002E33F2E7|nr:DUF1194 domain-containing protein [Hyphomicrobium sp.]HEX2841142.1 DUF1194 domain-containing protein [Hyphomicrobium sp.]
MISKALGGLFVGLAAATLAAISVSTAQVVEQQPEVDTALIVSVDVSNSVDENRYKLQMEGIAKALEDPEVLKAILNGPQGGILVSMVTWADKPRLALPWQRIASAADAAAVAAKVRALPRQTGEFTCVSGMLRSISDKVVPQIPAKAMRVIVDVSGDGRENCNPDEPPASVRDELNASGVTVNGLPILEGDEGATLEQWYRENVMGGPGSFILPANGFGDFGRAIRQKFMIEISGNPLPIKEARASD